MRFEFCAALSQSLPLPEAIFPKKFKKPHSNQTQRPFLTLKKKIV